MCISNPRTCCRITMPRWSCRRAPRRSSGIRTNWPMCWASTASAMRSRRPAVCRCASSCRPRPASRPRPDSKFRAPTSRRDEIRELMSWPDVAGLAEVMDMRAVLEAQPRMIGILGEALASGKIIEGHARGLSGPGLQAFLSAGISADHEITSGADALEKLRAGFTVEIRGSHDYLLPDVVAAINTLPVIPTQPHGLHRRRISRLPGREGRHQRRAAPLDPLRARPAAGDPLRHDQQCDPAAARRSRHGRGRAAGRPGRAVRPERGRG